MPKRIPTPPPGDDEPRYLTVCHPYPASNLEIEDDLKALVFWISAITGAQNIFAVFHKPTAQSMVIIEVNREFKGFKTLLGAHKWGTFLKDPSEEEKGRVSKMFWCTYSTGREVEKHGWKRKMVKDKWFREDTTSKRIVKPYPLTTWCTVPSEHVTALELCRPLPNQEAPPKPPSAPRPPPVGSSAWMAVKGGEASPTAAAGGGGKKKKKNKKKGNNGAEQSASVMEQTVVTDVSPTVVEHVPRVVAYQGPPGNKSAPLPLYTAPHPHATNLIIHHVNNIIAENNVSSTPPVLSPDFGPSGGSSSSEAETPLNETTTLPKVEKLSLAEEEEVGEEEEEDDDWGAAVRGDSVTIVDSVPASGGKMSSYWDVEEPEVKTPVCPHHKVTCRKGICIVYDKFLKNWEKKQQDDVDGGDKEEEEEREMNSDDDGNFFEPAISKKRVRYGGAGGGRGRGGAWRK